MVRFFYRNPFYGENWASFNLNTLDEWIDENNKDLTEITAQDESIKAKVNHHFFFQNSANKVCRLNRVIIATRLNGF